MSDDSRYGIHRGLFTTLCIVLMVVAIGRSCANEADRKTVVRTDLNQSTVNSNQAQQLQKPPAEPAITPEPKAPPPPLHPVHPDYALAGWNISLQQCTHADLTHIKCWGYVENTSDYLRDFRLNRGTVVDDDGNSIDIYNTILGQDRIFSFDQGGGQNLMPNVKVRFYIQFVDTYLKAKILNFELTVHPSDGDECILVFKDVPIQ